MKRIRTVIAGITATVSLAIAAVAYAYPGGDMEPGMGPFGGMNGPRGMAGRMAGNNPAAMIDNRLTGLKGELKITAEQETAWQAFATKAKQQAESIQAMRDKIQGTTGSAPERMGQVTEMMKQRLGGMESMTSALKDLYAVLTPEQKAVTDKRFGRMGGRRMAVGPWLK